MVALYDRKIPPFIWMGLFSLENQDQDGHFPVGFIAQKLWEEKPAKKRWNKNYNILDFGITVLLCNHTNISCLHSAQNTMKVKQDGINIPKMITNSGEQHLYGFKTISAPVSLRMPGYLKRWSAYILLM